MALRENKAIAILHSRILRIDIHFLKIKIREAVCSRKRSARMP